MLHLFSIEIFEETLCYLYIDKKVYLAAVNICFDVALREATKKHLVRCDFYILALCSDRVSLRHLRRRITYDPRKSRGQRPVDATRA